MGLSLHQTRAIWTVFVLTTCLAAINGCSHSESGPSQSDASMQAATNATTDPRLSDQQRAQIQQNLDQNAAARAAMQTAAQTKHQ